MLKPALQLKLGQQLTMTPQLQQAIRLLQLPVLELQAQIREALESNVMLEPEEEESGGLETDDAPPPHQTAYDSPPPTEPGAATHEERQEAGDDEFGLDLTDADTNDQWTDSSLSGPAESSWSGDDQSLDFSAARGETLQEHLSWQLEMSRLDPYEMRIGAAIIDAINDDGYLIEPLEEIAANLQPETMASVTDLERILKVVQAMEPAGVGARSVGECIELQLRQLDPDTPGRDTALLIAAQYLDEVAEQQYALLRRQLRVTEAELENALALVRSCRPRPGSSVHSVPAEYIVPDVFIRRTEKGWAVDINPASLPRIRVNQSYASLIGRSSDHAMLRTQLQEARWLIRSLEIRNDTLLKVARCIVQRQSAFLEHGDEHMQPMILKDVAEAVQMHESTISRVTTNKYMHTHRGVFEFRYFFSSHVAGCDGTELSSTAIRAKIRKLVATEEPGKPLSDSRIAAILAKEGVLVARRTVAKYREALGIQPSSERKRIFVR
ncbi:RNA polymerase sigma-54 factor [Steroidobacter denitrificans]|uniref:RNA polymerase sigma-54 factor n=1 Tax=Steroidobacter denitrificans TaxID=465721 RepID=A0A127F6Q9_STEDE|nr:RNA polymerase factor sigma-54 [Steroidobacter denitrificans]AMN46123.1 RNA polymerase sigma-54 factor [Steroidobacter denitrificans]